MALAPFAQPVPLSRWNATSRLVAAWLRGEGPAVELGPPRLTGNTALSEARARHAAGLDRAALVAALAAGHQRLEAPQSAQAAVRRLGDPKALAVVTGQQPGLLIGPLYTPYKILTAVVLARRLEADLGRPVVPVYWCAAEDHDFDEAAGVTLHGRDGAPVRHVLTRQAPPDTPLARLPCSVCNLDAFHTWWTETVAQTEFSAETWRVIAETYAASASYSDWTIRLLWHLLPDAGLVIVDPTWPEWRALAAPLLARELEAPTRAGESVTQAGVRLREAGFGTQMYKTPHQCAFFVEIERRRRPVRWEGRTFQVGEEPVTADEMRAWLRDDPQRFSPGAMLRPVIQDALLPTVASVLGPGEIAYLAQLSAVYERHGVPRPPAVHRFAATLVEPPAARTLRKYELRPEDLFTPLEALRKRVVQARLDASLTRPLESLAEQVSAAYDALLPGAVEIDPTMESPLRKQRDQIADLLGMSADLIVRRAAQRSETLARQLGAARDSLAPGGQPQERVYSLLSFLNRYGLAFLDDLVESVDAAAPEAHHYLTI